MSDKISLIRDKRIICCARSTTIGHIIPIITLAKFLSNKNEVYFINNHKVKFDIPWERIIVIPFEERKSEDDNLHEYGKIFEKVKPDISLNDFNYLFNISSKLYKTSCTISILRSELFLNYEQINLQLPEKFENPEIVNWYNSKVASKFHIPHIESFKETLIADVILIPSIPDIDLLPKVIPTQYKESIISFIGPLTSGKILSECRNEEIHAWIQNQRNKNRQICLFTLGTDWQNNVKIYKRVIQQLLNLDSLSILVIVPFINAFKKLSSEFSAIDQVRIDVFSDLNRILLDVDIVIHQCGHGISQMCLQTGTPSITISSGDYDRDDKAVILERIGVSKRFGADINSFDISIIVENVLADTNMRTQINIIKSKIDNYQADCLKNVQKSIYSCIKTKEGPRDKLSDI